jgi:phosphonate transport system substrate-binding protein
VDRNSTSGYLYPKAGLLKEGMEPERHMEVVFTGHDEVVRRVANGECDAGFTYERMLYQQVKRRQVRYDRIAVVWESDIIPGAPMVVADKLPQDLRAKLTAALQEKANADYLRANGFCQVQCAIAEGDEYGYVPVDDSSYNSVREICKVTGDKSCALDA